MELTIVEKNKALKELSKIFWIFLIGSLVGFILETIVALIQNGHFVSRQGLIFGPFVPVYGLGLLVYYLVLPHAKTNIQIFIAGFVIGGIVEYLFSYFQEKYFGTISWDYSNLLFNFNGRTSILHCIYWGTGAILFIKILYPYITNLEKIYVKRSFKFLTLILIIFMTFNISITSLASQRQFERRSNIVSKGAIDKFLDEYYPDSKLNKIYSKAKIR